MPDSFKHDVDVLGAGQATFEQCWFASYKMIFKFAKRNTNEVEDRLRKAGNFFDEAMKLGLLDTDYKKSAEALGLKAWTGSPFNLKPSWYDFGLSDGAHRSSRNWPSGRCGCRANPGRVTTPWSPSGMTTAVP